MVVGRYCACEILIANPINWLYAACLEYFIFYSIDSSDARKQYDEYCLSIMQTITYAHDRTHIRILIAPWYLQTLLKDMLDCAQKYLLLLDQTILIHFRSSIDRPLSLPQFPGSNNYFSIPKENI